MEKRGRRRGKRPGWLEGGEGGNYEKWGVEVVEEGEGKGKQEGWKRGMEKESGRRRGRGDGQ